jgi:hypothetical protein
VSLITKHSDELPDLDQNAKELIADGVWSMFESADQQSDIQYIVVTPKSACCNPDGGQRFFLDKTGNVLSLDSPVKLGNPCILQGVTSHRVRVTIG